MPVNEKLQGAFALNQKKFILDPFHTRWELEKHFLMSQDMRPMRKQAQKCACLRKIAYSAVGKYQAPKWYMRLGYRVLSLISGQLAAACLESTARKYNDIEKFGGKRVRQFGYAFDWKVPAQGWRSDKMSERRVIEFRDGAGMETAGAAKAGASSRAAMVSRAGSALASIELPCTLLFQVSA